MAKFIVTTNVNDDDGIKKFTFRIRDMYEKYTTEVTVKASSVQEAKQKVKSQLIGWANFIILSVKDDTGASYYGRDLINFKDSESVVKDESTPEELIENSEYAETVVDGVYNKYATETDKEFLRESIKEMNRYVSNWSFMSAKEKRNIAPGGKSELQEHLKNAQARLAQLTDSSIADADSYFKVTYKVGENVYSAVMVAGATEEDAKKKFIARKPKYADKPDRIVGVTEVSIDEVNSMRARGMSVLDSDSCDVKDWNGTYNGATYDYTNGRWTITHKNGKVETFPDEKFNKIEELYAYIDSFKDSNQVVNDSGCNLADAIEITKEPGTDKPIYVMQSDLDGQLYFYIGKTYSMKDGTWTYAKFKMNGTSPEQLKRDLEANGWHQVNNGPASIIDNREESDISLDVNDSAEWDIHYYDAIAGHARELLWKNGPSNNIIDDAINDLNKLIAYLKSVKD